MSKGFYIGGYLVGFVLFTILFIIAYVAIIFSFSQHPNDVPLMALGLLGIAMVPLVLCTVVYLMFIYRMWAAIQDGQARMTSGKAAGFMLIPFFNLYLDVPGISGVRTGLQQIHCAASTQPATPR